MKWITAASQRQWPSTNVLKSTILVKLLCKRLNVSVFNLMSRNNETRHIKWQETCKCICRLDKIICNIIHINKPENVIKIFNLTDFNTP